MRTEIIIKSSSPSLYGSNLSRKMANLFSYGTSMEHIFIIKTINEAFWLFQIQIDGKRYLHFFSYVTL